MYRRMIKTTPMFLALCLLLLWANVGWSVSAKQNAQAPSPTPPMPTPTLTVGPTTTNTVTSTPRPTPTLTPLPPEYLETPDQTIGILFGAVFLVIIIVGGTFFTIRRKR